MNQIIVWAAYFALCCYGLGMLFSVMRLYLGPSSPDRVLALDSMYINGILILLTLGLRYDFALYFDIALLMALFGFVGSAAMAKFLLRGEVIER